MTTLKPLMCPECMVPTDLVMDVTMSVDVPVLGCDQHGGVVLAEGLEFSWVQDYDPTSTVYCPTCEGECDESMLVLADA